MRNSRFGVVGAFLFVVAVTALLVHLWQSQLIAPSGATRSGFSEEHAFATLSALLKEQRPHTAGSPENAVVRDRILASSSRPDTRPKCRRVSMRYRPAQSRMHGSEHHRRAQGNGRRQAVLARALRQRARGSGRQRRWRGCGRRARARSRLRRQDDPQRHHLSAHRRRGDRFARRARVRRTPSADAPRRDRRQFRGARRVGPEHDVRNRARQRATDESVRPRRRAAVGQLGELRSLQIAAQRHRFLGLSKAGIVRLQFRVLEFGLALSLGPGQSSIHRPSIAAARRRACVRGRRRARRCRSRHADRLARCQFLRCLRPRHRALAGGDQCAARVRRAVGADRADSRAPGRVRATFDGPCRVCFTRRARAAVCIGTAAVVSAGHLARRASARSSTALARPRRAGDFRNTRSTDRCRNRRLARRCTRTAACELGRAGTPRRRRRAHHRGASYPFLWPVFGVATADGSRLFGKGPRVRCA